MRFQLTGSYLFKCKERKANFQMREIRKFLYIVFTSYSFLILFSVFLLLTLILCFKDLILLERQTNESVAVELSAERKNNNGNNNNNNVEMIIFKANDIT